MPKGEPKKRVPKPRMKTENDDEIKCGRPKGEPKARIPLKRRAPLLNDEEIEIVVSDFRNAIN